VATFALLHGAASDSWYWHRLIPELKARGHDAIAPDLPVEDGEAGFSEYADVVVEAIGDNRELVVVAQSLGGFTAALVCERVPVDLLVLLNAMVPAAGETAGEWWGNTGWSGPAMDSVEETRKVFFHDLDPDLADETMKHGRDQSGAPFEKPYPLAAWPEVPTKVLSAREDRFFPIEFQRLVSSTRLDITPDEIDGGHLPALSRPVELADRLETYLAEVQKT
jgi:pimeloyl-ACP methyl ester carboxylesterase